MIKFFLVLPGQTIIFCLVYGGEQKNLVNSQVLLNLTPLEALAICVFKAFVTQRVC